MPWKETCTMDQRLEFVRAWRTKHFSFSSLCERYGISRKTGYKWLARFCEGGEAALSDRTRAPRHHPNQTPADIVEALLELKHRHPDWGPVTLISYLHRTQPARAWPAPSTAGEVLKRHGLVRPRKRPRRTPPHSAPLRHVGATHDVWSADFKGEFLLGDGQRCYPLTLTDNHSRFLIECKGLYAPTLAPVKRHYELAFRRYGLPRAIRTDNGYPFASVGLGGLTALSVWLLRLGVTPERIAPGHPEQNPRHERMHRTLKAATASPPRANLNVQQRAFNRFRVEYNELRPHQGLGNHRCPGDLFHPSTRPFPSVLPELDYPDHFLIRRVRSNGDIKCHGRLVFLSETLTGQPVGLEPLDHQFYQLHFASLILGVLDARTGTVIRPDKAPRSRP